MTSNKKPSPSKRDILTEAQRRAIARDAFWRNDMPTAEYYAVPSTYEGGQLPEIKVFPERSQGEITQAPASYNPIVDAVTSAYRNYTGELKHDLANGKVPGGKYTIPATVLGAAGLSSLASLPAIGEVYHAAGLSPLVMEGLTVPYTAHGLDNLMHGNADWQTALEIAPLANYAKPIYNAARPTLETVGRGIDKAATFLSSGQTGKWTQFGNKEYRFEPGRMFEGLPINKVESRPALPKWAENNPLWTPADDGALINTKTGLRFVFNPAEGKWQSEASLNYRNAEMSKKAAREAREAAAASKLKKREEELKRILDKFEDEKITGFSVDEWKAFRKGFKTTDADIKEYKSHLQEYYDLFKKLKGKKQLRMNPETGKWEGLVDGKMVPVNARQYIRAHSKNFIDNGWKYDGFDRGTAMFPETAQEIQNNGGSGAANWTTNNNTQLSTFSQQRNNGPILRGIVSTRSTPDRIIPVRYAHEADLEKYQGITAFDSPVGLVNHPEITGDWKIFGPDMLVKAIDGNNGLYSNIIKNPLSGIIPPVGIGYIANEAIEDTNEDNKNYGF